MAARRQGCSSRGGVGTRLVTIVGEDSVDETFLAKEFGNFLEERLGVRVVEEGVLGTGGFGGGGGGQGGVHTGGLLDSLKKIGGSVVGAVSSVATKKGRQKQALKKLTAEEAMAEIDAAEKDAAAQKAHDRKMKASNSKKDLLADIKGQNTGSTGNASSFHSNSDQHRHVDDGRHSNRHNDDHSDDPKDGRQHDYGNDHEDDHSMRHSPRHDDN
jgi:hypothetical protein